MLVKYSFYLNNAKDEKGRSTSMMDGYKPGDPLVLAYADTVEMDDLHYCDDSKLEFLWRMFNQDYPPDYKQRSMSVGDVVILGDGDERRGFCCASLGWEPIPNEVLPG